MLNMGQITEGSLTGSQWLPVRDRHKLQRRIDGSNLPREHEEALVLEEACRMAV